MDKKLYSFAETCETLGGICRNTLYDLIKEGRLHPIRIGRLVMFPEKELDRFIENEMREQSAEIGG